MKTKSQWGKKPEQNNSVNFAFETNVWIFLLYKSF